MSTARLNRRLEVSSQTEPEPVSIQVHIDTALHKKLIKLNGVPVYPSDSPIALSRIANALSQVNRALKKKSLSDSKRLLLEDYKCVLLESISTHLDSLLSNRSTADNEDQKKKSRGVLGWLKTGFIFLISLVGLAESSAGCYLGMSNLLSLLIPTISQFWLMAATIGVMAINVVLFAAFEVDMLKSMLNINTPNAARKIIETHQKQVEHVAAINNKLTDINVINQVTRHQYQQLINITMQLNDDAKLKEMTYQKYREHPVKKILRLTLTVAGAAICGLGSYWGGSMMLAAIAAPLVGTPVGWCILGGLVLSNLVFYLAMQGSGMKSLFNPCMTAFNSMKATLQKFMPQSQDNLNRITLGNKHVFKRTTELRTAGDIARPLVRDNHDGDRLFQPKRLTVAALVDPILPRYKP